MYLKKKGPIPPGSDPGSKNAFFWPKIGGQTVIFETYFIYFFSYLYQTIGFVGVRISFSDLI